VNVAAGNVVAGSRPADTVDPDHVEIDGPDLAEERRTDEAIASLR
jgi:hypothetical protein